MSVLKKRTGSSSSVGLPAVEKVDGKDDVATFDWSILLDRDHNWEKNELCDVLYYMRQIMALVAGMIVGIVPGVGWIWFWLFVGLSSGIVYVYYALTLKVDEEEFGGHAMLLQEGIMPSTALFMLTWVLLYTWLHFD